MRSVFSVKLAGLVFTLAGSSASAVHMDLVTVGNPGNGGELSGPGAGGTGSDRICGGVAYTYHMGKFEVTAGQYTEFLNAVAKTDTHGLYNTNMYPNGTFCKIQRSGSAGNYVYSVAPEYADRPVDLMGWGDAARFANWMHNGQPSGLQDLGTTEDGSYYLDGAVNTFPGVTRKPDATWVIPTEDEWYKAAYHKNDGVTANYWDYPTDSDLGPDNQLGSPADSGNNATFRADTYTIGAPYYRTEAGAHENSVSPYGTFDQGGNVWEWTETLTPSGMPDPYGGLRGGSYDSPLTSLHAANRHYGSGDIGFRVAYIPEPSVLVLLILGAPLAARQRRRRLLCV